MYWQTFGTHCHINFIIDRNPFSYIFHKMFTCSRVKPPYRAVSPFSVTKKIPQRVQNPKLWLAVNISPLKVLWDEKLLKNLLLEKSLCSMTLEQIIMLESKNEYSLLWKRNKFPQKGSNKTNNKCVFHWEASTACSTTLFSESCWKYFSIYCQIIHCTVKIV